MNHYFVVYEHWHNGQLLDKGTMEIFMGLPITQWTDITSTERFIKQKKAFEGNVMILSWQRFETWKPLKKQPNDTTNNNPGPGCLCNNRCV